MKKLKLFVLPFASTGLISGPTLCTDGGDLLMTMELDDEGEARPICLKFLRQRAVRQRSESYCTAWHVNEVFDAVCEVSESDWASELREACAPEWRNQ